MCWMPARTTLDHEKTKYKTEILNSFRENLKQFLFVL